MGSSEEPGWRETLRPGCDVWVPQRLGPPTWTTKRTATNLQFMLVAHNKTLQWPVETR